MNCKQPNLRWAYLVRELNGCSNVFRHVNYTLVKNDLLLCRQDKQIHTAIQKECVFFVCTCINITYDRGLVFLGWPDGLQSRVREATNLDSVRTHPWAKTKMIHSYSWHCKTLLKQKNVYIFCLICFLLFCWDYLLTEMSSLKMLAAKRPAVLASLAKDQPAEVAQPVSFQIDHLIF